jgi:hypothetical protein
MPQKKLQNYFNDFLPLNFFDFKRDIYELTSNQALVAELLRICCEEADVKAIQMAFERILGKPEKVIVIKRTMVRVEFPDAETKALKPKFDDRVVDEVRISNTEDSKIVVEASNAPGLLLRRMVDEIGAKPREYSYEVLDNKDKYTVAEVMAANLYGIAMAGSNLAAIKLLFDYLDGAVADVIRLEGMDTILLENWADVAPFEAIQDENGVWFLEKEAVA